MGFRCLQQLMLILAFIGRIRSFPLACPYNGTFYKEGESVRTEEPCLSCVCQKGVLECSLRVCTEHFNVIPLGCFLVHKPNDCCPQLLCEERLTSTGIEFRTGFKLETKLHGNDCMINGSLYAEGSALASSRVCEYCYCIEGEMKCVKPRCLQSFVGCKAVYEKSSCCPTYYDCRDAGADYFTTEMKNFARVHTTAGSDSLGSLSISEKSHLKKSENMETNLPEAKDILKEEIARTTFEEINTTETSTESEHESTVPPKEDCDTSIGFQTKIAGNHTQNSKKATFTETTTFEPVTDSNIFLFTEMKNLQDDSDVQTRNNMDFHEETESPTENGDNSSSIFDYDSYDYNEPQLPPSLPNLVIFPFVAADAIVKEDSTDAPTSYEKVGIESIDELPVFNKEFFSPPPKTEGGFIPKEPSKSVDSFNEQTYFREQLEPPSTSVKGDSGAEVVKNSSTLTSSGACVSDGWKILPTSGNCMTCTCQRGAVVCQDIECPHQKSENLNETNGILNANSNRSPDQLKETGEPKTDTPANTVQQEEPQKLYENQLNKKPVTVTYKNVVVDIYPNHLVTTVKDHFNLPPVEKFDEKNPEENLQYSTEKTQNAIDSLVKIRTSFSDFFEKASSSLSAKTTRENATQKTEITTISTIALNINEKEVRFDELIESYLLRNATSEATASTAVMNTKHKYSSKIKGQIMATLKPKQEDIRGKVKTGMSEINSTTYIYSKLNSIMKPEGVFEKTTNFSPPQKLVKEADLKQIIQIPFDLVSMTMGTKNSKVNFPESLKETNNSSVRRNGSNEKSESGKIARIPNFGAYLKLAGCNIYGMMYRVGKIITELSGPCLECLCTELGVQCRPLKC